VQQLKTKRNSDHSKRYYIWNKIICPFDWFLHLWALTFSFCSICSIW
jgi:hypothetical protein